MYWPIGIPSTFSASLVEDPSRYITSDVRHGSGLPNNNNNKSSTLDKSSQTPEDIRDITASRTGEVFATIGDTSLSIWQTKPTAVLATVLRSAATVTQQGYNVTVHLQPDASAVAIRTTNGYLVIYALSYLVDTCVYRTKATVLDSYQRAGTYRPSTLPPELEYGPGDGQGIRKLVVDYQTAIHIHGGIQAVIALDSELLVSTKEPRSIQRICAPRDQDWSVQTTESLNRMSWLVTQSPIVRMTHDRPMRLHVWLAQDGHAYAVQLKQLREPLSSDPGDTQPVYQGYCFHRPGAAPQTAGNNVAINARFSLIAVVCADSSVQVYHAKDYTGNIPLSHELRLTNLAPQAGELNFVQYSPDGYCLFVGHTNGWAMWSVYGKLGATSFGINKDLTMNKTGQDWLLTARAGFWTVGGSGLVYLGRPHNHVHAIDFARSSFTACFNMANVSRTLLQTGTGAMFHRGLGATDLASLTGDASVWQTIQLPPAFLSRQWPVRCSVVSPDGNYLAVAGRRGLAHYSVASGRWRSFENVDMEDDFVVRGGMCWYQYVLVTAVDADRSFQIRLYSREKPLDHNNVLYTENLQHPVIHMSISGTDSLLVYTHDNMLHHYIFVIEAATVRIEQVGTIGFHGIIRAPSRIRSMNWFVPEEQRDCGLPSQDVAMASILFLMDAKLVLLQPSSDEHGALKYDMRMVAHDVEFYLITREALVPRDHGLNDSLWVFNGHSMLIWPDVRKLLSPTDLDQDLPQPVTITPDFYPLTAIIETGVLSGVEPEIVQRQDVDFAHCRLKSRTELAIPGLLKSYLASYDSSTALHLCESYQALPYFAHALEILLHGLLEAESGRSDNEVALVVAADDSDDPLVRNAVNFLSSFPCYLDVIVGCTRKTEMRTWRRLFKYLPPVQQLFEESLQMGSLKTAGGLLLILHTFDEASFTSQLIAKLLRAAADVGDWDLCKELARFLVGIDDSGDLLKDALECVDLR